MKNILFIVLFFVPFVVSAQPNSFDDENINVFVQAVTTVSPEIGAAVKLIAQQQKEVCGHEINIAQIMNIMASSKTYAYVLMSLTKGRESNERGHVNDVLREMQCGGENPTLADWVVPNADK